MKKNRLAFTLIELLIVVAIIAILAAIAVPNFLEAQTRAKVAGVQEDFRTIATSLEAYRVDNTAYPPTGTNGDNGGGEGFIEPPKGRLAKLTTPVPYITKVPGPSPFLPPNTPLDYDADYQYSTQRFFLARYPADDIYLNGMMAVADHNPFVPTSSATPYSNGAAWIILDRGPDQHFFFDFIYLGVQPTLTEEQGCTYYDPTNGTVSLGDMGRTGKKMIN